MRALLLLAPLLAGATPPGYTAVSPDDPRIVVVGRSVTTDAITRFDWPGVRVRFRLEGGGFRVLLNGTGPDFNVLVDGQPWTKLGTWGAPGYDLWLPDGGVHDVTLVRRQGPVFGATRFAGLELPAGVKLLDPPKRRPRRIEFVGDSLTVGYGVEALHGTCEELRPYENSAKAFASVAADALNAEPWIAAASGHGVVRNFSDPNPASARPMSAAYADALFSEPSASWTPTLPMDAAVVFLGTNDVSTEPAVPHATLVAGYQALIESIRARHDKDLPVFLVSDASRPRVVAAVTAAAAGRAHPVHLPKPLGDWGCDHHPGVQTQQLWGAHLAAAISETLGWSAAR